MRFQFSRRSPIAQWAVRFRTAPRLGRLSVKSDRRAQAAAMMPLIRIEVTPALSGIFIKRAGIGGPKTTALQSLSRRYSGVSWFRSSVGEQTWSTMRYSSPDRLDGTRVPRSSDVLPCGLESGCARTPTYDDPMAGG